MTDRYTATLLFDDHAIAQTTDNNPTRLIAFLISHIEKTPNAFGKIVDNFTGSIIQQCRKSSVD